MKNNWRNNLLTAILLLVLLIGFAACGSREEKATDQGHAETYTCPMHPSVISDKPGTCPICGMDLVRKARHGEEIEMTEDLAALTGSPNETVVASIKTVRAEYKKMPVITEAQGVVTYDTRNIYTMPARFGGRLEKVYLKYPFQKVSKGQKVAVIYSPELLTAQRELLFLIENDPGNYPLIESARNKLLLLGATPSQVERLISKKEILSTFVIYSPYDGYVITDDQKAPTVSAVPNPTAQGSGMGGEMGGASGSSAGNNTMSSSGVAVGPVIREGDYVSPGQTLFKIVNTSSLRVELNIPSSQAAAIRKGNEAELDFGNGKTMSAKVEFIQPFFSEGEDFVTVRVYAKDTQDLHIGHLVKAVIKGDSTEGLWIPSEAVLDLGQDKIVFVKEGNVLKPRSVAVGVRAGTWVEVRQGISSSDEIAVNAGYLVDSESFIKAER